MEKIKRFIPYAVIVAVAYYIIPLIGNLFPQIGDSLSGALLLSLAVPLVCLLSALFFGLKYGMSFIYIILAVLIYLPQAVYYKSVPVVISGFIYLVFTFIGIYAGAAFMNNRRIKKKEKEDKKNNKIQEKQ